MGKKFDKLERKIGREEHKVHPTYSPARIKYIASAAAGEVARQKANYMAHPMLAHIVGKKPHHCAYCGILH